MKKQLLILPMERFEYLTNMLTIPSHELTMRRKDCIFTDKIAFPNVGKIEENAIEIGLFETEMTDAKRKKKLSSIYPQENKKSTSTPFSDDVHGSPEKYRGESKLSPAQSGVRGKR